MTVIDTKREQERNRLLRRADWRFLLPQPCPEQSIAFTGGSLAAALGLISDEVAAPGAAAPGSCDLAVARDPDQATLRAAWAALRPGGACYTEWWSPLAGGAQALRRRLESAGFTDVSCYWRWPIIGPALFWLPIEAHGALRYFLASRTSARTAPGSVGQALRLAAWLLVLRAGLLRPLCLIARKAEFPAHNSTCDQHALLLLTGGKRSINKAVVLAFDASNPWPQLAVKMPRVPESSAPLRREAGILDALGARPGGAPTGVPRLLFCHEHTGLVAVGETALAGQPLFTLLRRDNYRELALKTTTWLIELAGRPELQPRAAWWGRLVQPVLDDFEATFGEVVDRDMLRETQALLATVGDLPLVCEQRDFSPWNVLVSARGDLVILDWEGAEFQGLPAMDLIYFMAYLGFFLDGAMSSNRFCESYRASLDPSSFTGAVMAECTRRYTSRLGLSETIVRPLRLLAWMLHSRSEYRRLIADQGRRPDTAALRRSLFVKLWEEELSSRVGLRAQRPDGSRHCR